AMEDPDAPGLRVRFRQSADMPPQCPGQLWAKALNRLRDSLLHGGLGRSIIPRGEIVGSGRGGLS
ncbi:MAG: hypothetical protein ACREV8_10450, partial [Gammaproteobacteria bacterium]